MEQHQKRVTELSEQVSQFYVQKKPFKIYHGSTNSTRIQVFKRSEMLDTSDLNHVLKIDVENKTALVEPNVPMDKLVRATLKYGLIPPVVPEFPGITVGGAVQGGAGESGSFRWGCFHQICRSYEIITGDGTVVTCNPSESSDLYYGTAGPYGTLGVMAAIELKLIPAKPYVCLTYIPVQSFQHAISVIEKESKKAHDFMDGIMFSADRGVIMVGNLTNKKDGKAVRFCRAWDDWFYLHAEKRTNTASIRDDYIPLYDYLFRYDRGAFWMGRYAFTFLGMPFNAFWRFIHDRLFHTRKLYIALQQSGMAQKHIIQDVALPKSSAVDFLNFLDTKLSIYPLWLCPLLPDTKSPFISSHLSTPLAINIGVWGKYIEDYDTFVQTNRSIEQEVASLGGKKWLYAHTYYSENEFWQLYDRPIYTKLRETYKTAHLPSIYTKVRVAKQYPISVNRGMFHTILGVSRPEITP